VSLFERVMLWGSSILVGVSGIVLAVMKYALTSDDPYAIVNHPLQPLTLKIHIVSAPLLVFAVGIVFVKHIWEQWRSGLRRGRISGAWTLSTFGPMVLSGYLVQTLTQRGWLFAMVVVHLVTGAAFLVGFVAHQLAIWLWMNRRGKRKLTPPVAAAPAEDRALQKARGRT
jgi:fluoride ion exporter CrcB/FEX